MQRFGAGRPRPFEKLGLQTPARTAPCWYFSEWRPPFQPQLSWPKSSTRRLSTGTQDARRPPAHATCCPLQPRVSLAWREGARCLRPSSSRAPPGRVLGAQHLRAVVRWAPGSQGRPGSAAGGEVGSSLLSPAFTVARTLGQGYPHPPPTPGPHPSSSAPPPPRPRSAQSPSAAEHPGLSWGAKFRAMGGSHSQAPRGQEPTGERLPRPREIA